MQSEVANDSIARVARVERAAPNRDRLDNALCGDAGGIDVADTDRSSRLHR